MSNEVHALFLEGERWLSVKDAAEKAGVSQLTVRNAIAAGDIQTFRPGKGKNSPFFIHPGELEDWQRKQTVRASESQTEQAPIEWTFTPETQEVADFIRKYFGGPLIIRLEGQNEEAKTG